MEVYFFPGFVFAFICFLLFFVFCLLGPLVPWFSRPVVLRPRVPWSFGPLVQIVRVFGPAVFQLSATSFVLARWFLWPPGLLVAWPPDPCSFALLVP